MFNKLTITNPALVLNDSDLIGGVHYTSTVNGDVDIQVGQVCSACITFKTLSDALTLNSSIKYEVKFNEDDEWTEAGLFYVESITKDRSNFSITAYDSVSKLDINVDEFIATLPSTMALSTLFLRLCGYCGLRRSGSVPANGAYEFNLPTSTNVTGRQLMQWIAEMAGGYVYAIPSGSSIGYLKCSSFNETNIEIDNSKYITASIADYETPTITAIEAQTNQGTMCYPISGTNEAVSIYNNPLIYDTDDTVLTKLSSIYRVVKNIGAYHPAKLQLFRTFGIRPGDIFTVNNTRTIAMTVEWNSSGVTITGTGNSSRNSLQNGAQALDNNTANLQRIISSQNEKITTLLGTVVFKEDLSTSGATIINGDNITTGNVTANNIVVLDDNENIIFTADSSNHNVQIANMQVDKDGLSYISPAGTGLYLGVTNPTALGEVKFLIKTNGGPYLSVDDTNGQGKAVISGFEVYRNDNDKQDVLTTLESYFTELNNRIYALEHSSTLYTVTLEVNGNGSVSGSGSYVLGSSVDIYATPSSGYVFDGWYAGMIKVSSSAHYVITDLNSNVNYVAKFVSSTKYNVTIAMGSTGGGIVGGNIGTTTYNSGTVLNLIAIPSSDYVFDHWNIGGVARTDNPLALTVDGNKQIYVYFKSKVKRWNVNAIAHNCEIDPDSQSVIDGQTARIYITSGADETSNLFAYKTSRGELAVNISSDSPIILSNIVSDTTIDIYDQFVGVASYTFKSHMTYGENIGKFAFISNNRVFDKMWTDEDGNLYYNNICVCNNNDWMSVNYKQVQLIMGDARQVMKDDFYNWFSSNVI